MAVMRIGHMHMLVRQGFVLMCMRMRLSGCPLVLMDMVLVVYMGVIVLDRFVGMHVHVLGAQEKDDAGRHDCHREELACAEVFAEDSRRNERSDERSGREVCSLPSRAQQAERTHGTHDAQAVAEEAQEHRVSHLG